MSATKAPRRLHAPRGSAYGSTQRARRRRAKRPLPPPSATPLPCLVLAVDTAARSGWAVLGASERYLGFGEADTLDATALAHIVDWAGCHAVLAQVPLVLVLEAPFGGSMAMLIALGAARERWLAAWRATDQPRRSVVMVQPSEWRAKVLGKRWARAVRDEVRPHEQATAAAIVGEPVGGDEAAAILIARWALRAAKVERVLPRRRTA